MKLLACLIVVFLVLVLEKGRLRFVTANQESIDDDVINDADDSSGGREATKFKTYTTGVKPIKPKPDGNHNANGKNPPGGNTNGGGLPGNNANGEKFQIPYTTGVKHIYTGAPVPWVSTTISYASTLKPKPILDPSSIIVDDSNHCVNPKTIPTTDYGPCLKLYNCLRSGGEPLIACKTGVCCAFGVQKEVYKVTKTPQISGQDIIVDGSNHCVNVKEKDKDHGTCLKFYNCLKGRGKPTIPCKTGVCCLMA